MPENLGIVCRIIADTFTIIWSITNQTVHSFDLIPGMKVGDYINIKTLKKPNTHISVDVDSVDGYVRLHKIPVRIRQIDDTLLAFSPILGEITDLHANYRYQVDLICYASVVWTKNDTWSIPEFKPMMSQLIHGQHEAFRKTEPCRGVIFRIECGSFVCWSENHGITELHHQMSQNIGKEEPNIGSFLWILVKEEPGRLYPIVKKYRVIKPFFKYRSEDKEFEVIETLTFDELHELINGKETVFLFSKFFKKIYDKNNYLTSKISSKGFTGNIEFAFRGINYARSPLFFEISKVIKVIDFNPKKTNKEEKQEEVAQKVLVQYKNMKGIVLCHESCFCLEVNNDFLIPDYIKSQHPPDYFIGKWYNFSTIEYEGKMFITNPVEIAPVMPTRILEGIPEIQFELTIPHKIKCSHLISKDLNQEFNDIGGVSAYAKLWLRREKGHWQISPAETFQIEASLNKADDVCNMKKQDLNLNESFLNYENYEQRISKLTAPPNYKIGFVSTEKFIYCPETRMNFYIDKLIKYPRSKIVGSWVYIRTEVFPDGTDYVEDIQLMPQPLFPTRVIGGIAEVQLECIFNDRRCQNNKPILYCPEFKTWVNDKLEVIKSRGLYRLWIARNHCKDIWFHIAQDERNPLPLRSIQELDSSTQKNNSLDYNWTPISKKSIILQNDLKPSNSQLLLLINQLKRHAIAYRYN